VEVEDLDPNFREKIKRERKGKERRSRERERDRHILGGRR